MAVSQSSDLSQDPKPRAASMWEIKDYSLKTLSVMQNEVMQLSVLKDGNQGWCKSLEFLQFFYPANSLQVLVQRDHCEKYVLSNSSTSFTSQFMKQMVSGIQ